MDDPEALIAGLQKNNNAGNGNDNSNGESGGGDGAGKKKKKKAKKSNTVERTIENRCFDDPIIIFMPFHQCFHVFSTAPSANRLRRQTFPSAHLC
jgi:hypothetical protein